LIRTRVGEESNLPKVVYYCWELKIRIEDANTVLEGLRLEVQLLGHRIHPVDPVPPVGAVKGARLVNTAVYHEGRKTSKDRVHGHLGVERLGSVTNSLAHGLLTRKTSFHLDKVATRGAISEVPSDIIAEQIRQLLRVSTTASEAVDLNRACDTFAPLFVRLVFSYLGGPLC